MGTDCSLSSDVISKLAKKQSQLLRQILNVNTQEKENLFNAIELTQTALSVDIPMNENSIALSVTLMSQLIDAGTSESVSADKLAGFGSIISTMISSPVVRDSANNGAVSDLASSFVSSFSQLAINGKYYFTLTSINLNYKTLIRIRAIYYTKYNDKS